MYTLEGFLARLALSTQAGDFVLKDSDPHRYDSIIGALRGELAKV